MQQENMRTNVQSILSKAGRKVNDEKQAPADSTPLTCKCRQPAGHRVNFESRFYRGRVLVHQSVFCLEIHHASHLLYLTLSCLLHQLLVGMVRVPALYT